MLRRIFDRLFANCPKTRRDLRRRRSLRSFLRCESLDGSGEDLLSGDAGDDVLLGEEGNDSIQGGAGRDILIGGLGVDRLQGQAHDDILIGGTTSYDDNAEALAAILAEWISARSYAVRVANIRSGATTGGFAQNSGTVQDDLSADLLIGNAGQDWFFAGIGDRIMDKASLERVN